MISTRIALLVLFTATLSACKKHDPAPEPAQAAPTVASTTVAPPAAASAPAAEPTDEERERAVKQGKLDYATMEDHYINDPHGQWAQSGSASSSFGDDHGKPGESNMPANVAGTPDGKSWTNNHQDIGFDWLEADFSKPVAATEVRIVCNENGLMAISKLEVQDTAGAWSTVWSGLADVKPEKRGPRNWFVKQFPKTAGTVRAVKVTFANNVASGYKEVDAVQLVGE